MHSTRTNQNPTHPARPARLIHRPKHTQAIEQVAAAVGVPVEKVTGPELKGIMCQFLKNHIVNGKHMLDSWTVNQQFTSNYFGSKLSVVAVGDVPQVKSKHSDVASIDKVATCGQSVAYALNTVLAPFPLPKLG